MPNEANTDNRALDPGAARFETLQGATCFERKPSGSGSLYRVMRGGSSAGLIWMTHDGLAARVVSDGSGSLLEKRAAFFVEQHLRNSYLAGEHATASAGSGRLLPYTLVHLGEFSDAEGLDAFVVNEQSQSVRTEQLYLQ